MCLSHFQTPTKKLTQTTNAEQGRPGVRHSSWIRDGYRFTGTGREHTYTHFLSPPLFLSFSTVTGQAAANRSARGRKRPGSEGTACVRVCMCVCDDKTNSLLKAALTRSYPGPSGCAESPRSSTGKENSSD